MNKKFQILLPGDCTLDVEGTSFFHPVDGLRFGFFVHKAHDSETQMCVSHIDSGVLVALVSDVCMERAKGDLVLAAREAVDEYAARRGSEPFKQALLRLQFSLKRSPI